MVEQALRIAQASLGPLGHHVHGVGLDRDRFLLSDPGEVSFQGIQGDAAEIKSLAAAENGGQHPLGIGGGQHEHHPRRWFLQGFQQCVEGGGGKHVALVHHIHLPAGLHWCEARTLDQVADVVDTGVGGSIDFDDIESCARRDRGAELAATTGFGGGAVAAEAVERAGQDAGAGGFTGAPWPAEQICGRDAIAAQGMAEGGRNGVLPHQLVEPLGAVLVMQRLVGLAHATGMMPRDYSGFRASGRVEG